MAKGSKDPESCDLLAMATRPLLTRAQEGDARAQSVLFARYRPRLMRWVHGHLPIRARDGQGTEDIVQETMVRAFKSLKAFEPRHEGAFLSFMIAIALNLIRDADRKAKRRPVKVALSEDEMDGAPTPLEVAIGMDNLRRYKEAMARLSEDHRTAIRLRFEMGCTYEEIARDMERSTPNAARLLVTRASARLYWELNARRRPKPRS